MSIPISVLLADLEMMQMEADVLEWRGTKNSSGTDNIKKEASRIKKYK